MIKYLLSVLFLSVSLYGVDIYFDTPDLHLLKNNAVLKYQVNENNETIIYESLTQKKHIYRVKHYNKVKYIEEKHPLLSLIKRKDRANFINILKNDGIKHPMKLRYILDESSNNSQIKTDDINKYKKLYTKKNLQNPLFALTFQYPYLMHLIFAIALSSVGLLIVFIYI